MFISRDKSRDMGKLKRRRKKYTGSQARLEYTCMIVGQIATIVTGSENLRLNIF